ncbi:reelin-like [Salvelinus sp. IW2-2015]|uniref:reelin-like n=1 Tax=Salvelinus sp. IW2-2015 TaxID=2691554 RepID=UPI0038D4AD59
MVTRASTNPGTHTLNGYQGFHEPSTTPLRYRGFHKPRYHTLNGPPSNPGYHTLNGYQGFHEPRYHTLNGYQGFHEPRIVSVELPPGARKFGVQFRWWQPYHSGRGHDVWAVDDITMTSVLFNTISLDFSNVLDVTQSLGFYLGHVQPYCQHDWTLSFSGEPSPGSSIRYVETQSMQIGASYTLQFSLVMGCGRDPSPNIDTQVRLEFSTNHGLTWHLVKEVRKEGNVTHDQPYGATDSLGIWQTCSGLTVHHMRKHPTRGSNRCSSRYISLVTGRLEPSSFGRLSFQFLCCQYWNELQKST